MSDLFPDIEKKLYDIHWDGVLTREEAYFLARQVANFRMRLETDSKPIPVWESEKVVGINESETLRSLRKELQACQKKLGKQTRLASSASALSEKQSEELTRLTYRCSRLEADVKHLWDRLRKRQGGSHEECEETIKLLQESLDSVESSLERWKESCISARAERDLLKKSRKPPLKRQKTNSTKCDWSGCTYDRDGGWRFCKVHLDQARKEIKESDYLTPTPGYGSTTKHRRNGAGPRSIGTNTWENVVRAIEDRE